MTTLPEGYTRTYVVRVIDDEGEILDEKWYSNVRSAMKRAPFLAKNFAGEAFIYKVVHLIGDSHWYVNGKWGKWEKL